MELDPYGEESYDNEITINWEEIKIVNPKIPRDMGKHVLIVPSSEYYNCGMESNPKDTVGVIYEHYGYDELNIGVNWENGSSNSYSSKDLTLVKII